MRLSRKWEEDMSMRDMNEYSGDIRIKDDARGDAREKEKCEKE